MRVPRHARPDHLVVVKAHPAIGDGPRAGLADIVEERREAEQAVGRRLVHHGQRVRQHVLMTVNGVLLECEAGELGQEVGRQPGAHDEPQCLGRRVEHHDLVELIADALTRDDGEAFVHRFDRRLERGVGLE